MLPDTVMEPDAETLARIEATKAALRRAKTAKDHARDAPTKRYVNHDGDGEASSTAEAARQAIRQFRRASGKGGRKPTHDPEIVKRVARENPGVSRRELARIYRETTGLVININTIARLTRTEAETAADARPPRAAVLDNCPDCGRPYGKIRPCFACKPTRSLKATAPPPEPGPVPPPPRPRRPCGNWTRCGQSSGRRTASTPTAAGA